MILIPYYIFGAARAALIVFGTYHVALYFGMDGTVFLGSWLGFELFLDWRRTMLGDFK